MDRLVTVILAKVATMTTTTRPLSYDLQDFNKEQAHHLRDLVQAADDTIVCRLYGRRSFVLEIHQKKSDTP